MQRRRLSRAGFRDHVEAQPLPAPAYTTPQVRPLDAGELDLSALQTSIQKVSLELGSLQEECRLMLPSKRDAIQERFHALRGELKQMAGQLGVAPEPPPLREGCSWVSLSYALTQAVKRARANFTWVRFRVPSLKAMGPARVQVFDGEPSMRVLLDHMIRNACEGDGRRASRVVTFEILEAVPLPGDPLDASYPPLSLRITDDGPGFAPEVVAPLTSTKANHHGLGLLICARLLEVSGANFEWGNAPAGGAEVHVRFLSAPS